MIAIDDHPDIVDDINSELGADTDDGCDLPVCQELTRLRALPALMADKLTVITSKLRTWTDDMRRNDEAVCAAFADDLESYAEKCRAHAEALKEAGR